MQILDYIIEVYIKNPDSFFYFKYPYFYIWFSFFSVILFACLVKLLGLFLIRDEDYYSENE